MGKVHQDSKRPADGNSPNEGKISIEFHHLPILKFHIDVMRYTFNKGCIFTEVPSTTFGFHRTFSVVISVALQTVSKLRGANGILGNGLVSISLEIVSNCT